MLFQELVEKVQQAKRQCRDDYVMSASLDRYLSQRLGNPGNHPDFNKQLDILARNRDITKERSTRCVCDIFCKDVKSEEEKQKCFDKFIVLVQDMDVLPIKHKQQKE